MFQLNLSFLFRKIVHSILIAAMFIGLVGPVVDHVLGQPVMPRAMMPRAMAQQSDYANLPNLQVIVQAAESTSVLTDTVESYGGAILGSLDLIDAVVATVPASQMQALTADARTSSVTIDAPMHARKNFVTAPLHTLPQASADEQISANAIPEAVDDASLVNINPAPAVSAYSLFLPTMLASSGSGDENVEQNIASSQLSLENLRADNAPTAAAVITPEPISEDDNNLSAAGLNSEQASPVITVYESSLHDDWAVVPWAKVDLASTEIASTELANGTDGIQDGKTSAAIAVNFSDGWDGLYLKRNAPLSVARYNKLSFWLHGGADGDQQIWVNAASAAESDWGASDIVVVAKANQWTYYEISVEDITHQETISGLLWQNMQGSGQPTFYLDNIRLVMHHDPVIQPRAASTTKLGLTYNVYHGDWSKLPRFDDYVPAYSGEVNNFDIYVRDRNYQSGIAYDGYIYISQSDWYRFYTKSDDGSNLYINEQKVVDNDGIHGLQERAGWIKLKSGYHRIEVDFFERFGAQELEVGYQSQHIAKGPIPNTVLFQSDPTLDPKRGSILREWWSGIEGATLSTLENHSNYPNHPTGIDYPAKFVGRSDWSDHYGLRLRGYLHPPTSGWYTFAIAGDDEHALWLSTNEDPQHADVIAHGETATAYRNWAERSSQISGPQYLLADKKYYIEARLKENVAGDHLTVAWTVPGGEMEEITGVYLSPFDEQEADTVLDPLGYNRALNVYGVHSRGITGDSVRVGYMDTGIDRTVLARPIDTVDHLLASASFGSSSGLSGSPGHSDAMKHDADFNGHGTFMAEIAHSKTLHHGEYIGVAPDATMYSWAVLDQEGKGTFSTIIRSLEAASAINIDVVNLSLQGPVVGPYWENPLNQAVEALWESGTVVVAAAGNTGPDAGSITTPGNDPFVITVGAYTDNYTPDDPSDDFIAPFSAAGPTEVGFVKPDVVAPGGHLVANLSDSSKMALSLERTEDGLYIGAGTSAATAYVSGVVALMLEQNPDLTPDEVKYRLIASAKPIVSSKSGIEKTFSIYQQGAGRIDPYEAVFGEYEGRANQDMISGQSYIGPAKYDAERDGYVLLDENGHLLPKGTDYFWNGGWIYSGGWVYSGGWAYAGGWLYAGGWIYSGTYDGTNDDGAEQDGTEPNSTEPNSTGLITSSTYWNSNKYWNGDRYWSGRDYWTGIFQDKR